jgi:two-component system, NarL family, response regulator YdfI
MSKRNGGGAIRVIVAATSALRRAGLESIIRSQPDFQLAASTGALARLGLYIRNSEADVVVADSDSLPELADVSAASFVLLTDIIDARTIARLLKAGVRSILPQESDPEEIVAAIYAAYSGHVLLSAQAAENLAAVYGDHEPEAEELTEEITPREAEVLRMLAEGLVNKDIASRLGISDHTVKFHISSILEKLGASTRTEAVTLGIRRGLIPI